MSLEGQHQDQKSLRHVTGKTADWKKAVVVLDADSHIDLF